MSANSQSNKPLIIAQGIKHSFGDQEVLHGISIELPTDQLSLVRGSSGSGKSTLLRCLSGLIKPDEGTVVCGEVAITDIKPDLLTRFRGRNFGFIFQDARLSDGLTVDQNIHLQHDLQGNPVDSGWVEHLLDTLEIGDKLQRKPTELSSGEKQRVGIARALAHRPAILFADEPTGALNSELRHSVYSSLKGFAQDGVTTVIVSHDDESQNYADKVIELKDGSILGANNDSIFSRP